MRLSVLLSLFALTSLAAAPIDRQAVVERHTIRLNPPAGFDSDHRFG